MEDKIDIVRVKAIFAQHIGGSSASAEEFQRKLIYGDHNPGKS